MWEDPRPDRIRDLKRRGPSRAGPVVIAIAAVAGFVAILINSGLIEQFRVPDAPPPAAEPAIGQPPSPGETLRPAVSPPPPRHAPAAPRTPSQSTPQRGDPALLQRLTQTCRYWTEQNTRGQYDGHQQLACDDMTRYAQQFGMAIQPARTQRPQAQGTTPRTSSGAQVSVYVDQCERHGYGSIDFRRCRANEKNRLTEQCRSLQAQRQRAQGTHFESLSRRAQAVCREADRYEIVR